MNDKPLSPKGSLLQVEAIQYLPRHRCPQCQAPARTIPGGAWFRAYQDYFGTALSYWQDHLGYVYFQCDCRHHPEFSGSLRVARLGDAILPVHFKRGAGTLDRPEIAETNAERVSQAVKFLAAHANPALTAGSDWLLIPCMLWQPAGSARKQPAGCCSVGRPAGCLCAAVTSRHIDHQPVELNLPIR